MAAHGGASAELDPDEWLRKAEIAYAGITSHTAVFHKQQRVAGKLLLEEHPLRWVGVPIPPGAPGESSCWTPIPTFERVAQRSRIPILS